MPAVAVLARVDAQFRALFAAQDIGPALRLPRIAVGILGFAVGAGAHRTFGAGRLAVCGCDMPQAAGIARVRDQLATVFLVHVVGTVAGLALGGIFGQRLARGLADAGLALICLLYTSDAADE